MFEAGALAKKLDAALVCPVLFDDLSDADVRGPLTDFQSTLFNRKDFEKLIRTINSVASDGGLGETTLKSVFEKWWPDLEKSVIDIMANRNVEPTEVRRSERELLEELLQLARAKSRADSIARRMDAKRIPFADRRRVRNFEVAGSATNKRRFWEAVRDGGSGWSVKNANDENDGDAWLSIVGPTMFDLEIAEQDLIKAGRQFDVKVTSC